MLNGQSLEDIVIALIVVVLSVALHEFGHAKAADYLGDPTPRSQGRVTLWPDKHWEITGFVMMVITIVSGYGIGWGKPVICNPNNFQHPKRDFMLVTVAGPAMNLLLALVFGLMYRILYFTAGTGPLNAFYQGLGGTVIWTFLTYNLTLMFFNLIPIHPLDGSKILSAFLPAKAAYEYDRFLSQYGFMVIVAFLVFGRGLFSSIMSPAVSHAAHLIVGFPAGEIH